MLNTSYKNSRDTPASTTYPSSGKTGGGKIKLYQSRCFYIRKAYSYESIRLALC